MTQNNTRILMQKTLALFLAFAFFAAQPAMLSVFAAQPDATSYISITKILDETGAEYYPDDHGVFPSFACDVNPLYGEITVHGIAGDMSSNPPGRIEQYNVRMDWGGEEHDPVMDQVRTPTTGKDAFEIEFSDSYTFASDGEQVSITAHLYHQTQSGQDNNDATALPIQACVYAEAPAPATLMLEKQVINDDGGTAVAADFSLYAAETMTSMDPFSSGDELSLAPGTYVVWEDAMEGYELVDAEGCQLGASGSYALITLAEGESATCTLVNDDYVVVDVNPNAPPVITVDATTMVINNTDYVRPGFSAYDFEDGDLTAEVVVTGEDLIDVNTDGTYYVYFDVSDSDGASAETVILAVIVGEDTGSPYRCTWTGPIGDNIVPNHDLEVTDASGTPLYWNEGGWGDNAATYTYPVADREGGAAASVTISDYIDGAARWYFDAVSVSPATQYVFQDYYTSTIDSLITAQFHHDDETTSYVNIAYPQTSDEWRCAEGVFTTPSDVNELSILHSIRMDGSLSVDDYLLFSVGNTSPDPTPTPILTPTPTPTPTPTQTVTPTPTPTPEPTEVSDGGATAVAPARGGSSKGYIECSDGNDNDGDGLIDDLDPGCSHPFDDSENSEGGEGSFGVGGNPGIVIDVDQGQGDVLGTCVPLLNSYMRYGADNDPDEVMKLQAFLNVYMNERLPVNGQFGLSTRAAVNRFQVENWEHVLLPWVPHGLSGPMEPTGYVYKTTRYWINKTACPALDMEAPELP